MLHSSNNPVDLLNTALFQLMLSDQTFVCVVYKRKTKTHSIHRLTVGNLSNDNGDINENITWKYDFISFVLLCDYFNPSTLYKNYELPRNQIGRRHSSEERE